MKISVIGLGKLGSCHAAVLASKGYQVIGADINPIFVDAINNGVAPVLEPELQEFIDRSNANLSATTDVKEAIQKSDVSFIIVPTPSLSNGKFSMEYAIEVARQIGEGLKCRAEYHVTVMTSTVMPGDTEAVFITKIEEVSGKKLGVDFGVCYNPEFIALGSVIKNMLNPDIILIGESDQKAGDIIEQIYKTSVNNNPFYARMNIINAEVTKISVNTYVTTKISYANMIGQICSKLQGANADIVLNAIGHDSRIGTKYLKAGLAFGGPCFPRDNIAFTKLAENLGLEAILAKATDQMNDNHTNFIANLISEKLGSRTKVGILGLSYKPNTPVIDVSPALAIARVLLKQNIEVNAFDPQAMENARKIEQKINYFNSMQQILDNADVIIIATPWEEFKSLTPTQCRKDVYLIDCWGILNPENWDDRLIQINNCK